MANDGINSLDDYARFITRAVTPWSKQKRIALAVAMAERWFPIYESFSKEYEWGDPATLKRAVQSIWNCVLGRTITSNEIRRLHECVDENTPHLDDFDAPDAIAACATIDYALNCCGSADNTDDLVMAMVSGFEGVAPGIYTFPEKAPPDVWELPQVQDELEKQIKLLKIIGDMVPINKQQIDAWRRSLTSPNRLGPISSRPKTELVKGLSNEAIFEQYRRLIELDLRGKWQWENNLPAIGNNDSPGSMSVGEWLGRYLRRKQAIEQVPMGTSEMGNVTETISLTVAAGEALINTQDASLGGK